jgi:predicted RNA polymerase sigma factor
MLERLGRRDAAITAFDRSLDLVSNESEREFLSARRSALDPHA